MLYLVWQVVLSCFCGKSLFSFPTITITKMAKMPFVADPRFATDEKRAFDVHHQIKEDVSMTHRKPYPQEHEIDLPRYKMS